LKFATEFASIIDLMAIVPFWASIILQMTNTFTVNVSFMSAIRILRIFKLFKADKYVKAITILSMIIQYNKEVLFVTLILGLIVWVCTSTLLWIFEKDNPEHPEFHSIVSALFTAVLMLTAQKVPENMSIPGNILVCLTSVFSVAVFAIPAGVIAYGFQEVAEQYLDDQKREMERKKEKEKNREVTYKKRQIQTKNC